MKMILTPLSAVSSGPRYYMKMVLTPLSAVSSGPRYYMKMVLTSLSAVAKLLILSDGHEMYLHTSVRIPAGAAGEFLFSRVDFLC